MIDFPFRLKVRDKINRSSSNTIFLEANTSCSCVSSEISKTPSIKKDSFSWRIKSLLARSPNKIEKASIRMDLPEPVSPVKIVIPFLNSKCMCSMRAKFLIPIRNNILIPHQFLNTF